MSSVSYKDESSVIYIALLTIHNPIEHFGMYVCVHACDSVAVFVPCVT